MYLEQVHVALWLITSTPKGLHIIYWGYGTGNIYKKFFKKVLAPSKEHDKKILAPYATPAKRICALYVEEIHLPQQ